MSLKVSQMKNPAFSSRQQYSEQVSNRIECLLFSVTMPQLTADDRAVVSTCFLEKGWRGTKICNEFRGKKWHVQTVNRLIKKIERENITKRKEGSGRPISVSTVDLEEIRRAISSFRPRIRSVIKNNAGPIKAYFG